jgi:hypothetical protein
VLRRRFLKTTITVSTSSKSLAFRSLQMLHKTQ